LSAVAIQRFLSVSVLLAFSVFSGGCGKPEVATSPAMDAIERELETRDHARLLERISTSGVAVNAFTTDGCSGGLSLAWKQLSDRYPEFENSHGGLPPWEECCIVHDHQYHAGGGAAKSAVESFQQRRDADMALRACVVDIGTERSGSLQTIYGLSDEQVEALYQTIADLMYRAVRLGGIPCTEEAWRWGYGWPVCDDQDPGVVVSGSN